VFATALPTATFCFKDENIDSNVAKNKIFAGGGIY